MSVNRPSNISDNGMPRSGHDDDDEYYEEGNMMDNMNDMLVVDADLQVADPTQKKRPRNTVARLNAERGDVDAELDEGLAALNAKYAQEEEDLRKQRERETNKMDPCAKICMAIVIILLIFFAGLIYYLLTSTEKDTQEALKALKPKEGTLMHTADGKCQPGVIIAIIFGVLGVAACTVVGVAACMRCWCWQIYGETSCKTDADCTDSTYPKCDTSKSEFPNGVCLAECLTTDQCKTLGSSATGCDTDYCYATST